MQEFFEKGYVSGLDGLDSSADRNFQIACMKIDWPDSINHLQQSALTSPGLDFWSPSSPSYPALLKAPRGRFKITSLPGCTELFIISFLGLFWAGCRNVTYIDISTTICVLQLMPHSIIMCIGHTESLDTMFVTFGER